MTLPDHELVARAEQARAILETTVFRDACQRVRDDAFRAFVDSEPEDGLHREQAYADTRALARVIRALGDIVADGTMAADRLAKAAASRNR